MPRPLVERGAIEPGTHERGHRLEGALGIVADHLVDVAEPRGSRELVLPGRDCPVVGHRRLGDVPQVDEVGPVTELLCGRLLPRRDEDQEDSGGRLPRTRAL